MNYDLKPSIVTRPAGEKHVRQRLTNDPMRVLRRKVVEGAIELVSTLG